MNKQRLLIALGLAIALVGALWGCSGDRVPTEPLPGGGAVLRGTVLDTGGRPAADAVLALEPFGGGLSATVGRALREGDVAADKAGVRSAVSDAAGGFTFAGLAAGDYLLTSSLRDHAGDARQLTILPGAAADAETTFVDIRLVPTGTFLGGATLENGTDHRGTIVYLEGTSYVAVTDAAGHYSLAGVPVGAWPARAMHAGYRDDATEGTLAAAGDSVTLSPLLLRLTSNIPPVIDSIGATTEHEGIATSLSGSASDADGTVSRYEWDFDGDGVFDWSGGTGAATTFVYPAQGAYTAKLRVTDNDGGLALAVVSVTVLEPLPTATYVSPAGDDANAGTSSAAPVLTIARGLQRAMEYDVHAVYVAAGTYAEVVTLVNGVSLYGGRHPETWDEQPGVYSEITGSSRPLRAAGITAATTVTGFHVLATGAALSGDSSVAITAYNCTSALTITGCRITAGNGAAGDAGAFGGSGAAGATGQNGHAGACDDYYWNPGGSGGATSNPGGAGGAGGNWDGNGGNGYSGATGSGPQPGYPGPGGTTSSDGTNGSPGGNGGSGAIGNGGAAVGSPGTVVGDQWQTSQGGSGSAGANGSSGGGGGGGGGQTGAFYIDGVGNSGGGGGGGGYGGAGGMGGQSGGASFGVLAINSALRVLGCEIVTGQGGQGGYGGGGGTGGPGGQGGYGATACLSEIGAGGNGGRGGNGGQGGGGAGGWGGPSYGIRWVGTMPTTADNTYTIGAGGTGGMGGSPGGAAGQTGPSGTMN